MICQNTNILYYIVVPGTFTEAHYLIIPTCIQYMIKCASRSQTVKW